MKDQKDKGQAKNDLVKQDNQPTWKSSTQQVHRHILYEDIVNVPGIEMQKEEGPHA